MVLQNGVSTLTFPLFRIPLRAVQEYFKLSSDEEFPPLASTKGQVRIS